MKRYIVLKELKRNFRDLHLEVETSSSWFDDDDDVFILAS